MFQTVVREQTLTQRAQQQLEELIISGKLGPGERLPSESDMGKMLGVSRTVVREAVRLLSARGFVDARTGSGIYVRELDSGMIRDPMDLLLRSRTLTVDDIVEVRALLEVHLAGLAAERASSEDIAAMEQSVAKLDKLGMSPREYAEIDVEFHEKLARAAGNPLFAVLAKSLNAVMVDPICFVYTRNKLAREDTIREHTSILERVRARDAEGARKAMKESLADAPDNWGGYPPRDPKLIPELRRTRPNSASRRARPSKPAARTRRVPPKGARG